MSNYPGLSETRKVLTLGFAADYRHAEKMAWKGFMMNAAIL